MPFKSLATSGIISQLEYLIRLVKLLQIAISKIEIEHGINDYLFSKTLEEIKNNLNNILTFLQ